MYLYDRLCVAIVRILLYICVGARSLFLSNLYTCSGALEVNWWGMFVSKCTN